MTHARTLRAEPAALTAGHTIQEEGVALPQRAALNFIGAAITATDNPGMNATDVTVVASSSKVFAYFIS